MRLIMISGTQTDNQRTWFQRIMKEGTELLCKHLVIVSGISITNRLMSTYKRCQESEDITTSQLEEQLGQVITMIKLRPDHEATNRHHLSRILYWTRSPLGSPQPAPLSVPCTTLFLALPVRAFIPLYPTTQISSELGHSGAGGRTRNSLWLWTSQWTCLELFPQL